MALFTDGTIARIEDLRAHESAVLDLASSEGVDVSAKLTIAQRELATDLMPFLTARGISRDLSNVVVTDAMVSAHALRTLAMIYRDLYQSRFNDRYEGKWREYAAQSDRAMRALLAAGVGLTTAPIVKAPAPVLASVHGGLMPARTYYVRLAWTRGARVTGTLSEAELISIAPGKKLAVRAPRMPSSVAGWVLYAGTSADATTLQATSALAAEGEWIEPDGGLRADLESWPVQMPDYYLEDRYGLPRG